MQKHVPFIIGYDSGRNSTVERAFQDHILKGRCKDCLAAAAKDHKEGNEIVNDDDDSDSDGATVAPNEYDEEHSPVPTEVCAEEEELESEMAAYVPKMRSANSTGGGCPPAGAGNP